jgi:thiamine-phosphate pyrophosphorylase
MRGLYAIIDADFLTGRHVPLVAFAERVISAKPAAVQLRAKRAQARDILACLRAIRPLAAAQGVPLFANDRPDLAVLSECDGVHVGQRDLDVSDVRRVAPRLRVGISTHHDDELRAAVALRPDYVAFGPVFETTSKDRPEPIVGADALERAAYICRAAAIPLVAIGGIDEVRAADVAPFADMGAIISGLLPPGSSLDGVTERAAALHRALGGT